MLLAAIKLVLVVLAGDEVVASPDEVKECSRNDQRCNRIEDMQLDVV